MVADNGKPRTRGVVHSLTERIEHSVRLLFSSTRDTCSYTDNVICFSFNFSSTKLNEDIKIRDAIYKSSVYIVH